MMTRADVVICNQCGESFHDQEACDAHWNDEHTTVEYTRKDLFEMVGNDLPQMLPIKLPAGPFRDLLILTGIPKSRAEEIAALSVSGRYKAITEYESPRRRYHFNVGDSSEGPVGLCADVVARSPDQALHKLREQLPCEIHHVQQPDERGPGCDVRYINVYINPEAITIDDIDQVEDA